MKLATALLVLLLPLLVARPGLAQDAAADASACPAPQIACGDDGGCTDPTSDPLNCGQCGTVCASDYCNSGACLPLECDGALCDTTLGSTCDVARPGGGDALPIGLVVAALALGVLCVVRRRWLASVWVVAGLVSVAPARAAPPLAIDVTLKEQPPPRRYVSVAWNPVPAFMLGKASFDIVIAPVNHHAIVLSPFYVSTTTVPLTLVSETGMQIARVPQQTFQGWGGEIGYRYYSGLGGPRGFFAGASFIIGAFTATAQNGTQTPYWDLGGAIDVGYQILVASRVSLAAGLGLQYTFTDKTLPNQQWPASIYANDRFNPRLLLSAGWAF